MSPSEKVENFAGQRKRKQKLPSSKMNFKKMKKNTKIPKAEELEELREAEAMFHSGLFKMQVEELLKEINFDRKMALEEWAKNLESFLRSLSSTSSCSIDDFSLNVELPIIKGKVSNKGMFVFHPPEKVTSIGSYLLDTSTNANYDIAVEIPKICWQTRDFLNELYHRKRALYLAFIAQSLQDADFVKEIKFSYQDDCHLKPIILITPKDIESATVRLFAYPAENAFKLIRFIPTRNNVRPSWLLGKSDDDLDIPTPYYNSTIVADLLLLQLNNYLKENISTDNIKNAIKLLKIWLFQRGLISGYGRLNGFIISMYVAYLLKKKTINSIMNPYQIFRCTLFALQCEKFEEVVSLSNETDNRPPFVDFQKMFPGIFLEESGFLNLLYAVSKETLIMVKHEAKIGLRILDCELPNSFSLLFMKKITFQEKFEFLVHLKGPKKFRKYSKELNSTQDNLDFGANKIKSVVPKICDILRKGLNQRVVLFDVSKSPALPWSIYKSPKSPNCGLVTIGLLLNPDVPLNNIEKGPLADDPEASEFRKFWGEQSELRRFQDGTIREAVFWPADTFEDKRNVFCQMVKDILKGHLKGTDNEFYVSGTNVDSIIHVPKQIFSSDFEPYGTGEEAHRKLMDSFNSLSKQLRKLHDLPLQISSIQGISPGFHFSEVFPPLSVSHSVDNSLCIISNSVLRLKDSIARVPLFTPALSFVIELEGSGKWPDDVEAIKRVKAAFLIKLAELVNKQLSLVAVPFLTHTDIVKDGFVFRLLIANHKELYLMKTKTCPNGITKTVDTEDSRLLELTTKIYPKLNSILHGLHQQHSSFGSACRLAKRWISAQLKYDYIHETVVELIMASAYIHPEPLTCPNTPQAGFIRFLTLIAEHDWKTSPLIVNLNQEFESKDFEEIYSTFTTQRSTLPPMVIATPFDKRGTLWTKNKPLNLILKRIIILAQASLETLNKGLCGMTDFDVKSIFRPPLDSFDVIIHLNRYMIPKLQDAVDVLDTDLLPILKSYKEFDPKIYPVVEFDPPGKYLEELRTNFGEFAYFFYDVYGGDLIGVKWKKSAFAAKEFKNSHANCSLYSKEDNIVGNIDSIVEDFKILGSSLVRSIKKKKVFEA